MNELSAVDNFAIKTISEKNRIFFFFEEFLSSIEDLHQCEKLAMEKSYLSWNLALNTVYGQHSQTHFFLLSLNMAWSNFKSSAQNVFFFLWHNAVTCRSRCNTHWWYNVRRIIIIFIVKLNTLKILFLEYRLNEIFKLIVY